MSTESVNEQLLFAYASFCAKVPELYKSRTFSTALEKADVLNHDRYCKIFGTPNLTFQILDNPYVKEHYDKSDCPKPQ